VENTSTHNAIHALLDEALLLSEDLFQLQQVRSSVLPHQTWLSSSESFPSICSRRTGRSPLHPESVSKSTMGETTRGLSQLLRKRLQTWRARMLSPLLCFAAYSCSLCVPGIILTSFRLFQNGPTRSNLSRHPPFCPQTAMPSQSPPVTNSRTPFNSSLNRSPTRPVGPRWLTARDCTEARERG